MACIYSSVAIKVLERAVNSQLCSFLNSNGILYEFQSGFRRGYSADTCLFNLTDHIRSEMAKANVVGMVLIDLQKAFDTCDHSILLRKLKGMGVVSTDWFRSYLSDHRQCVQVGGVGAPRQFEYFFFYVSFKSSCVYIDIDL